MLSTLHTELTTMKGLLSLVNHPKYGFWIPSKNVSLQHMHYLEYVCVVDKENAFWISRIC